MLGWPPVAPFRLTLALPDLQRRAAVFQRTKRDRRRLVRECADEQREKEACATISRKDAACESITVPRPHHPIDSWCEDFEHNLIADVGRARTAGDRLASVEVLSILTSYGQKIGRHDPHATCRW